MPWPFPLNTESLTIRGGINIRAESPVVSNNGDNVLIQDFDLRCLKGDAPIVGRKCDNLVIMNGSGQGGKHALSLMNETQNQSGLTIIGYRHEQPDEFDSAWNLMFSPDRCQSKA